MFGHAQQPALRERINIARVCLAGGLASPQDVRTWLGNRSIASESCVTAVYIALAFLDRPFLEMLTFLAACRGDVDTIGAMAGGIWGARNGDSGLPPDKLARLEDPDSVRRIALELHRVTREGTTA